MFTNEPDPTRTGTDPWDEMDTPPADAIEDPETDPDVMILDPGTSESHPTSEESILADQTDPLAMEPEPTPEATPPSAASAPDSLQDLIEKQPPSSPIPPVTPMASPQQTLLALGFPPAAEAAKRGKRGRGSPDSDSMSEIAAEMGHLLEGFRGQVWGLTGEISESLRAMLLGLTNMDTKIQARSTQLLEAMNEQAEKALETYEHSDRTTTILLEDMKRAIETDVKTTISSLMEQVRTDVQGMTSEIQSAHSETRAHLDTAKTDAKNAATAADTQAKTVVQDLKIQVATLKWKLLAGVGAIVTTIFLVSIFALTIARPGWTLSQQQQLDLQLGMSARLQYLKATESEQAQIRKLLKWDEPKPDSKPDSNDTPARITAPQTKD